MTKTVSLDQPWALPEVVATLVEAARHLLKDHACDRHGYEAVTAAADAGEAWLREREQDALDTEQAADARIIEQLKSALRSARAYVTASRWDDRSRPHALLVLDAIDAALAIDKEG